MPTKALVCNRGHDRTLPGAVKARHCVLCAKLWRQENKEKRNEQARKRWLLNPAKYVERGIRWRDKHPEATTFYNMLARCNNPEHISYRWYGGRGIKVLYPDWQTFLADVGHKPGPEYSIDRIDNDGNYAPGNCRWATKRQQTNNKHWEKAA